MDFVCGEFYFYAENILILVLELKLTGKGEGRGGEELGTLGGKLPLCPPSLMKR